MKNKLNKVKIRNLFFSLSFLFCTYNFAADSAKKESSKGSDYAKSVEQEYKPHGWARCQMIKNETDSDVKVYFKPLEIRAEFPEGSIVAIKALKTGFGNYYQVKKDEKGVWRLFSNAKNSNDPATHFLVSHVGKDGMAFSSEVANGFFVESDPKTSEVFLSNAKQSNNTTWTFVEDPKAGPTSQSCFLKNKATGGFLTSNYQGGGENIQADINTLKGKIAQLEKDIPYLKITYARSEGILNSFEKDLSRDIKDRLTACIGPNGVLDVPAGNWVSDFSGVSTTRWKWGSAKHHRTRDVKIRYMEGEDKTEKEIKFSQIEGKPIKIVADVNKHPATALKAQLEVLEKKMAGQQKLKTSEVAYTGFQGTPFDKADQWSKVLVKTISSFGQDEDESVNESAVVTAQTSLNTDLWMHQNPEFKGFGLVKIPNFGSDKVGFFDALYSQGVAWFDSILPVPGQGTIFFRAKADQGDVHVCFGETLGSKVNYRVAFGAQGNSKVIIYKNGEKVQEVSSDLNPLARVVPGEVEKFWVSINKGFILVGKGDAGANVIMGWQDPHTPPNILYMGLSTFKTKVLFADIQKYPDPIIFFPPKKVYVEDKVAVEVGGKDDPAWHKFPLSPPSAGMIVFKAKGKDLSLILADATDDKDGYKVTFGTDVTKINDLEDDEELCKVDAQKGSLAALDSDKIKSFWLSFYKGFFVMGSGNAGSNPFLAYYDYDYSKNVSRIGFCGNASVQDLQIWPEIEFGFPKTTSEYTQKRVFSAVKGNLIVLSPFNYSMMQQGPQVVFRDKFTGDQWNVAGTPEPDSTYLFSLRIKATGDPDFKFVSQSVSPEKKALKISVELAEKSSEIVFKSATMIAQGTTEFLIPSLIATAAAAAVQAGDITLSALAAAGKGKLAEIEAAGQRQIAVDETKRKTTVTSDVDSAVKQDREDVIRKLDEVSILDLTDTDKIESITKLWLDILNLVTGFYVVDDASVKQKIIGGMKNLYETLMSMSLNKDSLSAYLRMMDILIKAYTNPYLTKSGEVLEEEQRKNWYLWINELFKKLYNSPLLSKTGLTINFSGEYMWLPDSLSTVGKGTVVFEAKTYKDIFVGFCENPFEVGAKSTRMYEIVFGEKSMSIRRKNMGDAVAEFDYKKIPSLAPDPMNFKKYWINFDKGLISGGVGDLGKNKLWEWKDPYSPVPSEKWIGFSTGQGEVTYKNIKIGSAISVK